MKIALIAPIRFLNKYCTTGSQLCYANLLGESSEYFKFYSGRVKAGDTVFLDLSPILPRKSFNLDLYMEIVRLLRPSFTVLPNVDYATDKTLLLSHEFARDIGKGTKYVGVLQGTSLTDIKRCYKGINRISNIIGLPMSLEKVLPRTKIQEELKITKPVIYLEVYGDLVEEAPDRGWVATALPLKLA